MIWGFHGRKSVFQHMIIDFVFKYEINMNLHRYLNSHYFYFVFPYFKFYKYFCQIIKLVFSLPSRFLFISAVNLSVFSFSVTPEMLFFQNLKLWQLTPRPFGITLLNVSSGCAALWFAACARDEAARRARECAVGGGERRLGDQHHNSRR